MSKGIPEGGGRLSEDKSENPIFLKLYVDAAKCGLIADMGADNWQTLCVIASYMDKKGECHPTQFTIAKLLGVRRETASKRVKKLTEYRWHGRPVIEITKDRAEGGKWDNARYRVLPISQLTIFEMEPEGIKPIHVTSSQHGYSQHGYTAH